MTKEESDIIDQRRFGQHYDTNWNKFVYAVKSFFIKNVEYKGITK